MSSFDSDEKVATSSKDDSNALPSVEYVSPPISEEEVSRIQRKIDIRIMPWLCLTYLFMRIDVNNVANAAIINIEQGHGIKKQLNLSPGQWNWVIACFFYTYAFFEPASTLLMKKTTPSFWIGRIMVTWGIIACCIASVQNYGGLITTRVLLGAAEAGYYPCVIYYLAFWFRPEELARRIAAFYSFGQLSGFVGGFIAFAVSFADGRLAGWRWLFIIEGIPVILMGFATFYILPDYPETAHFLTAREKAAILARLSQGAPSQASKTWDKSQVIRLLKNPTFWSFSFVWAFHAVGGFGLSYVLPTVIFQLGFTSSALSNVLSMPPTFCTFVVLNTLGWLIQKHAWNPFRVAMMLEFINIICCILLLTVQIPTVKYICLLVATATAGSVYPVLWPPRVKAAHGTTAAAIAIGCTNALSQLSGILGPTVFSTIYGPIYRVSFSVCAGLLAGSIIAIAISGLLMKELYITKERENTKEPAEFEIRKQEA